MPKGTEDHVGFFVPQSKHTYDNLAWVQTGVVVTGPTLFAGFVFSFSKIFCDWALVAEFMVACPVLSYISGRSDRLREWVGQSGH